MDEVLLAFLNECSENLDQLDNELVQLEQSPKGAHVSGILSNIFRTVHTIKGSCGWLGLEKLESVAHVAEDLLVALREYRVAIDTTVVSTLLESLDAIRQILNCIEQTGNEGHQDYSNLKSRLQALQEKKPLSDVPPEPPQGSLLVSSAEIDDFSTEVVDLKSNLGATHVRVDVKLLDKLMNLVGELVLSRNQMLQFKEIYTQTSFVKTTQNLNLITSELQESVMKTRMQTIDTLWNKFPRVVRDLALECGKQVRIEMTGKQTELDRTILEAIKDPLTHLVRNAIDHGLEPPEERLEKGKAAEGVLHLNAYHEGGYVNIAISDDGRGLDLNRVKQKAIQTGLISASEASMISEKVLSNLIFEPGFSTAEKVTNISGRGVGMDVVRNNIEEIGGLIDLNTKKDQGTTFKIKIPLTLAIIPALMIESHSETFAIPQMNLIELVALEPEEAKEAIELIHNTPVYRLRGKLLPLVYLNEQLGMPGCRFDTLLASLANGDNSKELNIVVLQADEQLFGLIVDHILDTEEIVVKPLGRQLKSLIVYAGATIMGDGKVALILDVLGMARKAQVISEAQMKQLSDTAQKLDHLLNDRNSLLLYEIQRGRKMAIPLTWVERLEEFRREQIEYSGDLPVIQYRGRILPLIDVSEVLLKSSRFKDETGQDSDVFPVIVCTQNGKMAGLVVERILDIVEPNEEESLDVQTGIQREGIAGAAVVQGQIVELLDIHLVVDHYLPSLFEKSTSQGSLLKG